MPLRVRQARGSIPRCPLEKGKKTESSRKLPLSLAAFCFFSHVPCCPWHTENLARSRHGRTGRSCRRRRAAAAPHPSPRSTHLLRALDHKPRRRHGRRQCRELGVHAGAPRVTVGMVDAAAASGVPRTSPRTARRTRGSARPWLPTTPRVSPSASLKSGSAKRRRNR